MKRLAISLIIAFACVAADARKTNKAIREFILDERTVYTIPVSLKRVTTISFPGPISAIDAAQVTADAKKLAPFQLAHTKGASFFSVRSLIPNGTANVNVRWKNKTYVIELTESDQPLLSVVFQFETEKSASLETVTVTPARLLALLDKAKSFPILRTYHPDAVASVEYQNYGESPRVMQANGYQIRLEEVFRFNPEDTLVFRVRLKNNTDSPLRFAPNGFSLRVGDRTYPQSISDASGLIPPNSEAPAYFAVTGTPNGGRNDISLKNDFFVIVDAKPEAPGKEDEE